MEVNLNQNSASKEPPGGQSTTECFSVKSDPHLLAQGWVRRHLVDADRALESVELYSSMGFDVTSQELTPEDFALECRDCASAICRSYVLIYTRARNADRDPNVGDRS